MCSSFAQLLDQSGYGIMPVGGKLVERTPEVKMSMQQKRNAKQKEDIELDRRHIGCTPGFTAPELLDLDHSRYLHYRNSFAIDVFSAGMSILCFLVKRSYYLELNYASHKRSEERVAMKKQVQRKHIDSLIKKVWSADELNALHRLSIIELVYRCIDFNPETRISVNQALRILLNAEADT